MTKEECSLDRAAAEWSIALREDPESSDVQARFRVWHDADPSHAQVWAEMGETLRIIGTAPPKRRSYVLPIYPTHNRSAHRQAARHPRRLRPQLVAMAAAACLAVVMAPTIVLRLTADHISGTSQVETITLADGSTVHLGPDSAIAVDYSAGARGVRLLSGQAMFEVRRDPARPFRVTSRDITTTVLGTRFDVRMIGDVTGVSVKDGRVRVAGDDSQHVLTAGDWLRFAPGTAPAVGQQARELVGLWREGQVFIRNRPISEALNEIRPWYKGRIILADRALGENLVSGAYDTRVPARSLELIVSPYGGRVYTLSPWLMIVTSK